MVGVVGAWGQLTQGGILRNPRTKYKRLKNVFTVTCTALSCGHIWARLLQPFAQSLIGIPVPSGCHVINHDCSEFYILKLVRV